MGDVQFTKEVNASKLREEILSSTFSSKVSEINTKGDLISISTKADLTPKETTELNGILSSHSKENGDTTAKDRARKYIQIGIELMAEVTARFQKRDLTQDELIQAHERFLTYQHLLYAGYFKLAKASLEQIEVDVLVPKTLIDQLQVKMQRYIDSVKSG